MKKIVRAIVEVKTEVWSERFLVHVLTKFIQKHADWDGNGAVRVKGFNAVMSRERKRGKRERRRFEAGR